MDPVIPTISCACANEPNPRFVPKDNPVDAECYDFYSKRTFLTRPNNLIESAIHMLMCGLGGGLVALHVAYMECGIFAAMATNVVLSAVAGYCACILVWSAQSLYGRLQMHELTYPDIMEAAVSLSPWPKLKKTARGFRYLVEASLMCHLYGYCCVFIIMIARNLKGLASGDASMDDSGNPSLKVIILCLMVPCAVICMVTDLKKLAPFALICDLFGVALILVLLWYSLHDVKVSPMDRSPYKSVMGLVQFSCVCLFVVEPMTYALPIENNMKQPKKFHFVVLAAMPIFTTVMLTVGFFGYWYYGEYAVAPITVHLPFSSFAVTVKVFLCLTLYTIFAVCFYLAFDIEWYYIRKHIQLSNYWFWERVYTILHVVVLTLIACCLPNVTRMMGVFGAISTTPAILIYPPFIELLVNWEYPGLGLFKWRLQKCILMISLGFILVASGTYYNIAGMTREISSNAMLNLHIPMTIETTDDIFWQRNFDFNTGDFKFNLNNTKRDRFHTKHENYSAVPNKLMDRFHSTNDTRNNNGLPFKTNYEKDDDIFWQRKFDFNTSDLMFNLNNKKRDRFHTKHVNDSAVPNKLMNGFLSTNDHNNNLPVKSNYDLDKISALKNKTFNVVPTNNSISIVNINTGNIKPNNSLH